MGMQYVNLFFANHTDGVYSLHFAGKLNQTITSFKRYPFNNFYHPSISRFNVLAPAFRWTACRSWTIPITLVLN